MWRRPSTGWLPIATHIIDIVMFSVFQYLTTGPSSPFFNYFIFSLFCGALRWGWRGTLATAPAVGLAYIAIAVSLLVFVFVILVDNVFARLKWQTAVRSAWIVAAVLGFGNILVLSIIH